MVTQGFYSTPSPTTSWVAQQSQRLGGIRAGSFKYEKVTLSSNTAQASASRISSKSLFTDKVPLPMSLDTDSCRSDPITARPAKNLDGAAPNKTLEHNDETNSDESDMYLMAAKEEGLHRQLSMKSSVTPTRNRQSRIRHDSLPSNAKLDSIIPLRHGPDCEQIAANLDSSNKLELYGQTGNETVNMDQINYGNIYNGYKRSSSVMSRDQNLKLYSPDQHSSSIGRRLLVSCALQQASSSGGGGGGGGRRSSVPDAALFSRPGNRQLKSLSTPHTYYSSPLVPRTTEAQETSEVGRQLEDTESTNSTTVQSTVWDELDDLKSRIHRLESVGKLPPNVGTENFRISNDRPLTATTTVTTMSTSPRRERANSKSSIDQNLRIPVGDTSYILKSALIKSKPFLDSDIYRVLELTASDAISLSSMLGNLGQSSSITHANASPYSPTIISDRQVRRKAESMCRSLTELCLALSEKNSRNEKTSLNVASRDINNQSTLESPNLPPSRLSPRPLSQLEVRRSNLLAPKVDHTLKPLTDLESSNTNQLSGRRTSLFFRSGRGKFEGSSEENEDRTRAPSRIFSEVHSNRKSYPREKIYPFNLSEKTPPIMSESTLPMRRHNSSASYSTSPVPTLSSFSRWRKSDQNQTERNRVTSSVVGRVIEDQEHNDSSFIESPTLESSHSLTRRTRHLSPNDITSAGQRIGFH
ncbi:LPXTG-motif cell wall anchor domain protein/predicted conserved protein [Erysiphe neolycopersici]|uniref:LPXTG-motif cell wall anchor domain protein/predicted conserved protein n=1 Tax=Erysiphe neolycopersici TaxID=212602 RepID=A0A420I1N4_9PEZI|nr:LPXTG-motif cell wall anchor domain protein/predicted conserved protein [Erysiphe neolycopersici]